jgi:hypothetical protein
MTRPRFACHHHPRRVVWTRLGWMCLPCAGKLRKTLPLFSEAGDALDTAPGDVV